MIKYKDSYNYKVYRYQLKGINKVKVEEEVKTREEFKNIYDFPFEDWLRDLY